MKVILFAVLENGNASASLLQALEEKGFNGTLLPATSIKHVTTLNDSNSGAFLRLSDIAEDAEKGNSTLFVLVDEEKLEALKKIIRDYTDSFSKIHGVMFVLPVEYFEGSF
jgi:uncharacterized protein YaaQ